MEEIGDNYRERFEEMEIINMGNYLSILGRIEFQAHVRTLVLDEAEVEEDHELEAFQENADLQKTLTI